jgi:hypothetical protein
VRKQNSRARSIYTYHKRGGVGTEVEEQVANRIKNNDSGKVSRTQEHDKADTDSNEQAAKNPKS